MTIHQKIGTAAVCTAVLLFAAHSARADVITEWNARAEALAIEKRVQPPPNARIMAMMHVAMFEAVNAIDKRYAPYRLKLTADRAASKDAAAASAAHGVLVTIHPDKKVELDAALGASLAKVSDEAARTKGVALGSQAAADIIALRRDDGFSAVETYRPITTAGNYVPTVIPLGSTAGGMKPWVMASASQFRPGPPPALSSTTWATDLNEIRDYGGRQDGKRSAEQANIAKFWFMTGPQAWNPIMRQLAEAKKLDISECARLFALVSMATSDSLVAVFEAKYTYNFWRPLTAIRNADQTGNKDTPRDASWQPLGETPMHPEYPCAHCISVGAAASLMQAVFGNEIPEVTMTSTTLPGVTRRWTKLSDYSNEVAMARIYGGFHYRFSTKAGQDMGKKIAELTINTQLIGQSAAAAPSR